MSTTTWQRIETLFEEGLTVEASERTAWLERTCAGDDALREELASLFAAEDGAEERLSSLVLEAGLAATEAESAAAHAADEARVGEHCGPYRLTELIGSGGMGAVYAAERVDEVFVKEVAVKLVREGQLSPASLSRFLRERQALAALDHPNIARVLDGGATERGQPFLVMERVRGEAIDSWCDARELSIRERVELFLDVAAAVQEAHRRLVVHRDIKPANVLVTDAGEAKLLDFGIAKILDVDVEGTQATERLLTPEFASPEQLSGEPITTASDVYSLGVLLFHLLTGRKPFELGTRPTHQLAREVCEEPPPAPSRSIDAALASARGTSVERLRRELAGDLDTILLTALRKEPERRYPSVEAFAGDLRRHLRGLPVSARRDTLGYRLSKFVRRNRLAVGAAVVVVVAGLAVGWRERSALERTRELAELNRGLMLASLEMLQLDPDFGRDGRDPVALRAVLDDMAGIVADLELEDQELMLAFLRKLSESYGALGISSQAGIAERIVTILESWPQADPAELALWLDATGRIEEAVAIRKEHFPPDHPEHARSLRQFAARAQAIGDYEEARRGHEAALALVRAAPPSDSTARLEATIRASLASTLHRLGRNDLALEQMGKAIAIAEDTATVSEVEHAAMLEQEGWILHDARRYVEAEQRFETVLGLYEDRLAPGHPLIARSCFVLGMLLKDTGRFADAEAHFERGGEIFEAAGQAGSESRSANFELARLYVDWGRSADAVPLAQAALATLQERNPDRPLSWASRQTVLGRALIKAGRAEEAIAPLEAAYATRWASVSDEYWEKHKTKSVLGHAYARLGRFEEAERLLLEAFEPIRSNRGADHYRTAQALLRIVELYVLWDRAEDAARYREQLHPDALAHPILQADLPSWKAGVVDG